MTETIPLNAVESDVLGDLPAFQRCAMQLLKSRTRMNACPVDIREHHG
jgi:hypothetical protein